MQALERGLLLLAAFRARPELTLRELGALLPIHRTSTLRLVQTLEQHGFLARQPATGRYRLGPATQELGLLAQARFDIRTAARPTMERLAAETGETVQLVLRDGQSIVIVDGIEGSHRVKVGAGVGERRPLHTTASGKCFLAAEIPAADQPAELQKVRVRGYAVNLEESEPGARFVAAPVYGPGGAPVAALALGAPADRLPRPRLKQLGERVRAAGQELSQTLRS